MDHITDQNMPEDLRKLAERVAAGEDPDEIRGIDRLWLYRAERDRDAINASQHQFFQWLEAKEPCDR